MEDEAKICVSTDGTPYLKCTDCPWNEFHELLRTVDPTIIGCNLFIIGGDASKMKMVHTVVKTI